MTLEEVRQTYPEYKDVSDKDLSDALYNKFYSDTDRSEFNKAVGYTPVDNEATLEKIETTAPKEEPGMIWNAVSKSGEMVRDLFKHELKPQTVGEAYTAALNQQALGRRSEDYMKQREEDVYGKSSLELDAKGKPVANHGALEYPLVSPEIALGGSSRIVSGIAGMARKAPEVAAKGRSLFESGSAFTRGSIVGDALGNTAAEKTIELLPEDFKKNNPGLTNLVGMVAGLTAGGYFGIKAEGLASKYDDLLEQVDKGKITPEAAETILKQDPEVQQIKPFTGIIEDTVSYANNPLNKTYNWSDKPHIWDKVNEHLEQAGEAPVEVPTQKPLNARAEQMKQAAEIPVGGSEDEAKAKVKSLMTPELDSQYKNMTAAQRKELEAEHERAMQYGPIDEHGNPLDDEGNSLFAKNTEKKAYATHRTNLSNLIKMSESKTIPAASFALSKSTKTTKDFGDIVLVAKESNVSPEGGAHVFGGDAWTPRIKFNPNEEIDVINYKAPVFDRFPRLKRLAMDSGTPEEFNLQIQSDERLFRMFEDWAHQTKRDTYDLINNVTKQIFKKESPSIDNKIAEIKRLIKANSGDMRGLEDAWTPEYVYSYAKYSNMNEVRKRIAELKTFKDKNTFYTKAQEALNKGLQAPADYMEAKRLDKLPMNDLSRVIVPSDQYDDVVKLFKDNGIDIPVVKLRKGETEDAAIRRTSAHESETFYNKSNKPSVESTKVEGKSKAYKEVEKSVKKLTGQSPEKVKDKIIIVEKESELPERIQKDIERSNSSGEVSGVYHHPNGKVYVIASLAGRDGARNAELTILHELTHRAFMRDMIDERIMDRIYKLAEEDPLVQEAQRRVRNAETDPEHVDQETLAYLMEAYHEGHIKSGKLKEIIEDVIHAFKRAVAKAKVFLGKTTSDKLIEEMTAEDIANYLRSVAKKEAKSRKTPPMRKAIYGEEGATLKHSVDKFKNRLMEWHKDSHPLTKNEDGTPKVFYHGTNADFNSFDKPSIGGAYGKGIYLTDNPNEAAEYGKNIYPVYVKTNDNPLLINGADRTGASISKKTPNIIVKFPEQKITTFKSEKPKTWVIVNDPNQIKSVHNRGTFDETNPNILMRKTPKKAQPTGGKYEPTTKDKLIETVQDYWRPVEVLTKGIDAGELVNNARKNIFGRVEYRVNKVRTQQEKIIKNITEYAKASKQAVEQVRKDLNSFMIAQHAGERNAALGEKAAGISTKDAQTALSTLKKSDPKRYAMYVALARQVREMNKQTLDILLDGQVITKELYDNLRSKYKLHVPLNRILEDEEVTAGMMGGKGFNVKSTGLKRAKGSELEVSDIIGNVTANVQEAIIRAEKNRVGLEMYKMFNTPAGTALGKTRGLKMVGKDHSGNPIMETPTDDMIVLYVDGKKKVIVPNDPIIAKVYNMMNVEERGMIANMLGPITSTIGGLYTRFNPEFALSNIIRDIQEAFVYNVTKLGTKGATKALSKEAVAMNAVKDWIIGKDSAGARLYEDMMAHGGTTGGITIANKTKVTEDVEDMFKLAQSKPRQAIRGIFKSIDNFNRVFEDSTRLAAYKQALEQGMTKDQAAVIAKETTIDFNRKGTATPWVNALYMFSNASVQGSAKMLRAMKDPKVLAGVTGTMTALSFFVDSHNDMVDPDWRNKTSEQERQSNYVWVVKGEDGKFSRVLIPIGWGFKPIKAMIESMRDVAYGKQTENPLLTISKAVIGGYNPVGGNDLFSAITPTVLDVASDVYRDKNWKGENINPKGSEFAQPSEKYFPQTPETLGGRIAIKVAQGTEQIGLELTPEDYKYIVKSYGGGPVNFSTGLMALIEKASKGEKSAPEDRVFLRRFYKETDPERLAKYEAKVGATKAIKHIASGETREEKLAILKDEMAKASPDEKKKIYYAVKYGNLIPKGKTAKRLEERKQWEENVMNPFQSQLTR